MVCRKNVLGNIDVYNAHYPSTKSFLWIKKMCIIYTPRLQWKTYQLC